MKPAVEALQGNVKQILEEIKALNFQYLICKIIWYEEFTFKYEYLMKAALSKK